MNKTIKIVVEREDGKIIEQRLTKEELSALETLHYMINDIIDDIKLNHLEKPLASFFHKNMFLIHDVINEGKMYRLDENKEFVETKKHYLVRRPRWKSK